MKPSKPVTPKMADKANRLYTFLMHQDERVSKAEIGEYLGLKNERQVRDVIALLSTKVPIISTSDAEGYKIAKTIQDLDAVIQVWQELDSRQEEIEKRKQPLIRFREKMRGEKVG